MALPPAWGWICCLWTAWGCHRKVSGVGKPENKPMLCSCHPGRLVIYSTEALVKIALLRVAQLVSETNREKKCWRKGMILREGLQQSRPGWWKNRAGMWLMFPCCLQITLLNRCKCRWQDKNGSYSNQKQLTCIQMAFWHSQMHGFWLCTVLDVSWKAKASIGPSPAVHAHEIDKETKPSEHCA